MNHLVSFDWGVMLGKIRGITEIHIGFYLKYVIFYKRYLIYFYMI